MLIALVKASLFCRLHIHREPATETEAIPIRPSTDTPKQPSPHTTPDVPLISNSPLLSSSENSLSPLGDQSNASQQHTMNALLHEKEGPSSSFFSGLDFPSRPGNVQAPPPPGLSNANPLPAFNGELTTKLVDVRSVIS